MTAQYLLLLTVGHVLGDFYFQTDKMAKEKDKNFLGVIKHSVEYLISLIIVTVPVISSDMLGVAGILSILHCIIDSTKHFLLKTKKIRKSGSVFVGDQVLHIISIFIVAYIMAKENIEISTVFLVSDICFVFDIDKLRITKYVLAVLILHIPSNILIQNILSGYKPRIEENELIKADNKVGRKIGTIERLIMLMFISMDQYAAMGLVLTAKSIARYDKIAKSEKFAEYYLLGTLLSTACVVCCKIIILQ